MLAESASHWAGVAWVTVHPAACSAVVSGAVVSPFCSSTRALWLPDGPEGVAARAAIAGAAATAATVNAAVAATIAAAGRVNPPAIKAGASTPEVMARALRPSRPSPCQPRPVRLRPEYGTDLPPSRGG